MKFVIPGGAGQVGTVLCRALHRDRHEVVVLSRHPAAAPWRVVAWDAGASDGGGPDAGLSRAVSGGSQPEPGAWATELDGADVVINLAGRSVNCRYGPDNRRAILRSRVDSVRAVGAAIARAARPPRVWLQASTATIYAHRFDAPNDEATGILGGSEPDAPDTWRFSIEVATAWERALAEAVVPATRRVAMRSAMIMSPDRGGIFDTILTLVRRGLGGRAGDGRQFMSWIHEDDFVRAVHWLIEHDELDGAVNIAAPNPLPNTEFMAVLRAAWGARLGLPAAQWMLELGAVALRTESELVLKSRRVVPGRLLREGFTFRFPEWPAAAADLCARVRRLAAAGVSVA